jgi:galactokinase
MAIDRWTTIDVEDRPQRLVLRSANEPDRVDVDLAAAKADPGSVAPSWGRYVAAVAAVLDSPLGLDASISTELPVGAGLSSSAALEVVTALALRAETPGTDDRRELARLCQRAEHLATGVPCGVMDQLISLCGIADHAVLIDCSTLSMTPIALPDGVDVVVRFVTHRTLESSAYADRVDQCRTAESLIGPLASARDGAWRLLDEEVLARRVRHVVTENDRVRGFALALERGDPAAAGLLLDESHASLRDDYEVSTPEMDAAVSAWRRRPGVFGVRMTGGGFGGCIVALCEPGALDEGMKLRAVAGAGPA